MSAIAWILTILCAAAYAALLWPSPVVLLAGAAALGTYIMIMLCALKRRCRSPRTLAAGIAAPFVWAVMLFLSYNAQDGY